MPAKTAGRETMTRLWTIVFVCVSYDLHLSASCQAWHWRRGRNWKRTSWSHFDENEEGLPSTKGPEGLFDCVCLCECVHRMCNTSSVFTYIPGINFPPRYSSSHTVNSPDSLPPRRVFCWTVLWPGWMVFDSQCILTKRPLCGPTHCGFDP